MGMRGPSPGQIKVKHLTFKIFDAFCNFLFQLKYFVTSDCKLLLTEKVSDLFHNCYCVGLKNKPKFYMWNMCRGDRSNAEIEKLSEKSMTIFNDSNPSINSDVKTIV